MQAFSYDPSHEDQGDEMKDKARDVAIFYVLLGVGCGLGAFISVCNYIQILRYKHKQTNRKTKKTKKTHMQKGR